MPNSLELFHVFSNLLPFIIDENGCASSSMGLLYDKKCLELHEDGSGSGRYLDKTASAFFQIHVIG
jgi:hypothetical protein